MPATTNDTHAHKYKHVPPHAAARPHRETCVLLKWTGDKWQQAVQGALSLWSHADIPRRMLTYRAKLTS